MPKCARPISKAVTDMLVFILLTVCIFGGIGFLMGQAIAETWRPAWQNVAYGFLLAAGNRFFGASLFKLDWTSVCAFSHRCRRHHRLCPAGLSPDAGAEDGVAISVAL